MLHNLSTLFSEMLTEVWDFGKETFKTIQPDFYIDSYTVRHINPFALFVVDDYFEDNCSKI